MNIVKINQISSDELIRLFKYLEKFATDKNDKKQFVLSHYKNFFPNLSFDDELQLHNIIADENKEELELFIKSHPNIDVNLDGDSKIDSSNDNIIQAKEKSLEIVYSYLKDRKQNIHSHEKQIIRAFELKCLKNIKSNKAKYNILKFKVSKLENIDSLHNLKKYEAIDTFDVIEFLSKVFQYYLNTGASTFLKYVFYYLDIIRLDPESDLSKKYLQNIADAKE